MNEASQVITCSPEELLFMAGLLEADLVLGIPDPFKGLLAAEVEDELVKARNALEEKTFIAVAEGGEITLDSTVADIVKTCSFPRATFIITYTHIGDEPYQSYLHVGDDLTVEQVIQSSPNPECTMTTWNRSESAYQRTVEVFQLDQQSAPPIPAVTLPESKLSEARKIALQSDATAVADFLKQSGLDAEAAQALAQALVNPTANGALVALSRLERSWETAGFGLLESDNNLWRLRSFTRQDANWVELIPCNSVEISTEIKRLINRFLTEVIS